MKSDNNATASPVSSSKTSFVVGEYCVSHEIGKGSFAVVHLAHKRTATTTFPSAAPVAIKSISKDKLKGRLADNLEQEIKILTDFTHGNIVGLYEIVVNPSLPPSLPTVQ